VSGAVAASAHWRSLPLGNRIGVVVLGALFVLYVGAILWLAPWSASSIVWTIGMR